MLADGGLLPPVRIPGHPCGLGTAPALGEHTAVLLEELGIAREEFDELRAIKAV
jgi:crotonobetainyl-CoA:carnitine CoA-transferase CaiB-like acyl-CoA transferase